MCQSVILSHKGATIISQCMDCKTLNIWLRNLLLNFTPAQFKQFREFASEMDVEEGLFPFSDGGERLVLRTPHSDICFTFNLDEWEDFQAAMDEAAYMQGVYEMVHTKS